MLRANEIFKKTYITKRKKKHCTDGNMRHRRKKLKEKKYQQRTSEWIMNLLLFSCLYCDLFHIAHFSLLYADLINEN